MNRGDSGDNVFFAQEGVVVSQTRLVVDGITYAMSSISSCKTGDSEEQDGGKKFLRTLAILASVAAGLIIGLVTELTVGVVIGIVGLVASLLFIKTKYLVYHIYLGTVSGEVQAVSSSDENFIRQIERAVNDAIIARG